MTHKIAILPGDGIGVEIVGEARKLLDCLRDDFGFAVETEDALVGGCAYDATGTPLPEETLALSREADSVLLGAVGGPKWEPLDISVRPEKGLLGLRAELALFANLRPAILYPQLADASTLRSDVVAGLDILIVRELTGGIYFGQPRGVEELADGQRRGFNTLVYTSSEVERIGRVAFEIAQKRGGRLCSVDKANVLECTEMWREVMTGTPTSSCRTCTSTTLPCSWCARPSSSTSWSPPTCSVTSSPTAPPCSPARLACCHRHR
jgi:3-isopropylmalate dehydrogenase